MRVNSVFTSYRLSGADFSQRLGDLAGPTGVAQTSLTLRLIPVGSNRAETVKIPYLADYLGLPFTDGPSLYVARFLYFPVTYRLLCSWENNCAANEDTNGVDLKSANIVKPTKKKQPRAAIVDKSNQNAVGLPGPFIPTLPTVGGSDGVIKSYILPGNTTGVVSPDLGLP